MPHRFFAIILTLTTLPASAQEWSRFRGADSTGRAEAPRLPSHVGVSEAKWSTPLPGGGVSSPIVWGTRLFLTAELEESGHRAVICYDTETGREQWRFVDTFQPHGQHKFNSFASSTPAADADHVYLAWSSGGNMNVLALTHDGKEVWKQDLGPYKEVHGSGASPVLAGDHLIVVKVNEGGPGFVAGLSRTTGDIVWKTPRECNRTPFSTPLVIKSGSGADQVVLSNNPAALVCLDPANGKVVWEVENLKDGLRAVSSPSLCDGVIFASVGKGGRSDASVAVRVEGGKPQVIWEGKKGIPYVPSPVVLGKNLVFLSDGGILTSIRAADGEVAFSERVFQDQAYSSPVCSGEWIYCISRSGKVATVAASPDKFAVVATSDLGEPCDATPAISHGKLFIRTSKRLVCFAPTAQP